MRLTRFPPQQLLDELFELNPNSRTGKFMLFSVFFSLSANSVKTPAPSLLVFCLGL